MKLSRMIAGWGYLTFLSLCSTDLTALLPTAAVLKFLVSSDFLHS